MERTLAASRGGSSRNSSPSNSPRTVRGRTAHTSSPLVVRGGGGTRGDRGGGRAGGSNVVDSAGPGGGAADSGSGRLSPQRSGGSDSNGGGAIAAAAATDTVAAAAATAVATNTVAVTKTEAPAAAIISAPPPAAGAASAGKQADAVGDAVAIAAAAADAAAKAQAVAAQAVAEAARLQVTANALAVTAATPSPLETLMRMLDENKRNDAAAGATSPVFKSRARTGAGAGAGQSGGSKTKSRKRNAAGNGGAAAVGGAAPSLTSFTIAASPAKKPRKRKLASIPAPQMVPAAISVSGAGGINELLNGKYLLSHASFEGKRCFSRQADVQGDSFSFDIFYTSSDQAWNIGNMHSQDVYGFSKETPEDPCMIQGPWLLSDGEKFVPEVLVLVHDRP